MTQRQIEYTIGALIGVTVVLALRFWGVPLIYGLADLFDMGPSAIALIAAVAFVLATAAMMPSRPKTKHGTGPHAPHDDRPERW